MRKTATAFLAILLLLTLSCSSFLPAVAQEAETQAEDSDVSAAETEAETALFMPGTYEQFLALSSANSAAFSDDYIAVSDGSSIYIYDREENLYGEFEGEDGKTYSNLCFQGDYLFFLPSGSDNYINYIDLGTDGSVYEASFLQSEEGNINCSYFIVWDSVLYCASISGSSVTIFYYTFGTEEGPAAKEKEDLASYSEDITNPIVSFTVCDESIYYSLNKTIYTHSPADGSDSAPQTVYSPKFSVSSFTVTDGVCYYSSTDKYVYALTDTQEDTELADGETEIENVLEVDAYDNSLYFTTATSVKRYSVADGAYDGYEITQYSDGAARLGGSASDVSVYDDSTVIADTSGRRVLVYTEADGYTQVSLDYLPVAVSAGKNTFLAASQSAAYLYDYSGNLLKSFDSFSGSVNDCTYSYGSYYLISGTNPTMPYCAGEDCTFTEGSSLPYTATALTSDIEGNIWILAETKSYCFTAENFLTGGTPSQSVSLGCTAADIFPDYAGNMYAVTSSGGIYKNGSLCESLTLGIVYTDNDVSVISFAGGFDHSTVYVVTDQGFILSWTGGIEALDSVDAADTYDLLTGSADASSCEDLLVTIDSGTTVVALDESQLNAASVYLPTAEYSLTSEDRTGIKICEIDGVGTVVALYNYEAPQSASDNATREYSLCLVLKTDLTVPDSYTTTYSIAAGYTSSKIGLYNLPALGLGTADVTLARNTAVTVLARISCGAEDNGGWGLDYDYLFVKYGSGDSAAYGFIPETYINGFITESDLTAETYSFYDLASGKSVTLSNGDDELVLSDGETLRVYGTESDGQVYATYTDENNRVWGGYILVSSLSTGSSFGIYVIIAVAVVTACVLISVCYLILRKQPKNE